MGQKLLTVANQTFEMSFDCIGNRGGVLVRLADGLEVRFNALECLPHVLEGLVGRRTWQAHRVQIEAELARVFPCA